MLHEATTIIVPLALLIGFDLEYWGVIPYLFLKDHKSIEGLGEKILFKSWLQNTKKTLIVNKKKGDEKYLGGKDGPFWGIPNTIALTKTQLLFGVTRLTYFLKFERKKIQSICVETRLKVFKNLRIVVPQDEGEGQIEFKIPSPIVFKEARDDFKTLVEMLKNDVGENAFSINELP